jgi:hypothetical protein
MMTNAMSVTTQKPSSESCYDWIYIAFATALDSISAVFEFVSVGTGPRHMYFQRISNTYESIVRTTITTLTRAPLQLVAPAVYLLCWLDCLRDNDYGQDKLLTILAGICDSDLWESNLPKFPLDAICFPRLVEQSESFWARFDLLAIQGCFIMNGSWRSMYVSPMTWITSLFSIWAETCCTQGLKEESGSAACLSHGLTSRIHQSEATLVDNLRTEGEEGVKWEQVSGHAREDFGQLCQLQNLAIKWPPEPLALGKMALFQFLVALTLLEI